MADEAEAVEMQEDKEDAGSEEEDGSEDSDDSEDEDLEIGQADLNSLMALEAELQANPNLYDKHSEVGRGGLGGGGVRAAAVR